MVNLQSIKMQQAAKEQVVVAVAVRHRPETFSKLLLTTMEQLVF
jgi:hypothetical protein